MGLYDWIRDPALEIRASDLLPDDQPPKPWPPARRWRFNAGLRALVFVGVFVAVTLVAGVVVGAVVGAGDGVDVGPGGGVDGPLARVPWTAIMAVELVAAVVAYAVLAWGMEGRRRPVELAWPRAVDALKGAAVGFLAISLAVGVLALLGSYRIEGFDSGYSPWADLFGMGLVAAVAEEILFRGAMRPNYAVPTGDFIQEWMDDNGLNAAEMARRLDVTPKHVSELLRAKVALSPAVAVSLEQVTGVSADWWNRLEARYRADLVRLAREADLAAQHPRIKSYPIAYLRTLGFVTAASHDKAGVVAQVLRFFRVASVDALEATWCRGVAYRKSAASNPKKEALLTWLTVAERDVQFDSLADFDKDALRQMVPALRALSRESPDVYVRQLVDSLAGVGVALCLVPEVPGLGIHGATRWIDGHPVIQLSLRGKTDDQLWFTLFHEIGHVLLHDTKSLFLAGSGDRSEAEADQYAADTLIPPERAADLPRTRNLDNVRRFAAEIGVAPGVVLGRIQRETNDYSWGQQLKKHFEFTY